MCMFNFFNEMIQCVNMVLLLLSAREVSMYGPTGALHSVPKCPLECALYKYFIILLLFSISVRQEGTLVSPSQPPMQQTWSWILTLTVMKSICLLLQSSSSGKDMNIVHITSY